MSDVPSLMTRFMSRLHDDAAFRVAFEEDPAGTAARLGFRDGELAAVASRDQVDFFAATNGTPSHSTTVVVVCSNVTE